MKRAIRRHHRRRIIKRWHRIFVQGYGWFEDDPWGNCKIVAGRGSMGCGCCMCANPRHRKSYMSPKEKLTIQERKDIINTQEQIEEWKFKDDEDQDNEGQG